jgi:hypothetical protein
LNVKTASHDTLLYVDEDFVASWDLEDKPLIQKRYYRNISRIDQMLRSEPRNSKRRLQLKELRDRLVEQFRERLRRRYNDQTVYDFDMKNRHFEPQDVGYRYDRVLNSGMALIWEIVAGETGVPDWHFAAGTGTNDTYPDTTGLQAEVIRVAMKNADTGYFVGSGTVLNASGFISESIGTFDINEVGAVDNDGSTANDANVTMADTFLFRSVFPSGDVVTHNSGTNFTTCVHAVYTKSV